VAAAKCSRGPAYFTYNGNIRETRPVQENKDSNPRLEKPEMLSEFSTKISRYELDGPVENGLRAPVSIYQYVLDNEDIWKMLKMPDYSMAYDNPGVADVPTTTLERLQRAEPPNSPGAEEAEGLSQAAQPPTLKHPPGQQRDQVRGRAAAKARKASLIGGRTSRYSSNGTPVYYTVTSRDPPLLKFKAPMEEVKEKAHNCCPIS
jgi:protein phosphatase 1 regulatory inhibitor subunit 16B